jgi:SAM-dependent methyltransferase
MWNSTRSVWRQRVKAVPGAVGVVRFVRSWLDPDLRTVRRIRASLPGQLLQPALNTKPDRYPEFFAFVADSLKEVAAPRLLSFGCSTGEEVFSLRSYLPNAHITGLDINSRAIAVAERQLACRPHDPDIRLVCAGSMANEDDASYDAIFAMAVLRNGELEVSRPPRCDQVIDFAQVERTVSDLARCLKPGGLLVIWYCQFRFADMAVSSQFDVVMSSDRGGWANWPLYGPDNHLLLPKAYCDAIFRKHLP